MKGNLYSLDEASLVAQCRNDSAPAQKTLFMRYAEDMMLLCLRYIPQQEDAREALMDGFMNFFKNIGTFSFRGEGSVKAWLKKIMVRCCLDRLRKSNPVFIASTDIIADDIGERGTAIDDLSAKEIMQMIHGLPDGYRTVFNLYVFEGLSHREIGDALGISENTSKSQLHRARVLLQEKISQTNQRNIYGT